MKFILKEYYLLFDLFLSLITPYMFCFASAMVMLSEFDEHMISYLAVTPIGKKGYILSRLALPSIISFIVSVFLMNVFSLTDWSFSMIILTCMQTSLVCIAVALLIFSLSHNKVEGMAMAKLSGLIMIGLPVPFFLFSNFQFAFSFLPSFWITKFVLEKNLLYLSFYFLITFILLYFFYKKFKRKII
jgi:fluoroquinolone transport system permease protein